MAGTSISPPELVPIKPASFPNEQDEAFNYELVYLRYLEACEEYFKMPKRMTGPWTQNLRSYFIISIKSNEMVSFLNFLPDSELEKYEIVLNDGEEKLVLVGTAIEVLPYEECFDIFVEVHRNTEHGSFEMIMKKLEKKFLIHDKCLTFFLLNCNVCKKSTMQQKVPHTFNDCVSIEILKAPIEDHDCRFILFYIDNATKYIFLRPLTTMDEYEISIEVLKIFTDFGPPQVIKTLHAPLLNNVLALLAQGGFYYDVSIVESDRVISESYYLMQEIVARTNKDSKFWSTTCRFIQLRHNCGRLPVPILNKMINGSSKPYNQVFFKKPLLESDDVSEKQIIAQSDDELTTSTTYTACNVQNAIKQYIIKSDSSDTDSASEAGAVETVDIQSILPVKTEGILHLSEDQGVINEINANIDMGGRTSHKPSNDNIDCTSDDIKIEYNPIETESYSQTNIVPKIKELLKIEEKAVNICADNTSTAVNVDNLFIEEESMEEMDTDASRTNTSFIVDNLPMKEEPFEESSISVSVTSELLKLNNSQAQNKSSECVHANSIKPGISEDKDSNFCSICRGIVLTDFICFACKKRTHIFCLNRVTTLLEKSNDTVTSFTYCMQCRDLKYKSKNAVKKMKMTNLL